MKSFHDLEDSFSGKSLKYKSSMFASRYVCIYFGKKTSTVICTVNFTDTRGLLDI